MPGMHQNQVLNHSESNKCYILNGWYWNGSYSLHIELIFYFVGGKAATSLVLYLTNPNPKSLQLKMA